jgi:hypothetical protein
MPLATVLVLEHAGSVDVLVMPEAHEVAAFIGKTAVAARPS